MFCIIFFFFFFSLMNFLFMIYFIISDMVIFIEWELISFNSVSLLMSILIDWMSLLFMSFVMLISSVVILYSKSYMSSDLNLNRFIILVMLFVFSMILLIISPNIISILLGWDGLGLISYCLVIYYQNFKSYNAGMLTFLMNRVGDVFILMVISWMLNYGSWNYVFYLDVIFYDKMMIIITLLLMTAAMTKSAQIPFSSWLPAAMAAPTPVSALVHSSTLVTAGVYLLIRFSDLLMGTFSMKILLILSCLTMFMSGIFAMYEYDLKKIIAFSTLSQLGLMMSILSMGFPKLAFFHLLTHAMFKALLFMCAGVIIHFMDDIQDIRFMGSMSSFIPLTSLCLNISNLSLCGFPFLSGFYSKDLILEMMCLSNLNFLVFLIFYISMGLTMCYTIRLLYYLMLNNFNMNSLFNFSNEDYLMLVSMMVLLMMSLISGSMMSWIIFKYPSMIYLSLGLKLLVLMVIMISGVVVYIFNNFSNYLCNSFLINYSISSFFTKMWFLTNLSSYSLYFNFLNYGYYLNKIGDFGWGEKILSISINDVLKNYSSIFQILFYSNNNNFKIYLYSFIMWMMLVMMLLMIM
nr:NADH dehydrogenase subunit 5 [Monopis longella]